VLTAALRFFVGQKTTLSIQNTNGRQGRIFWATKNLKGTVNRFRKAKIGKRNSVQKIRAVLTVALWVFRWTKNNSEHINLDSKMRKIFCATKNLKGTVNRAKNEFCFCGLRK
jgi:hypothetical protein